MRYSLFRNLSTQFPKVKSLHTSNSIENQLVQNLTNLVHDGDKTQAKQEFYWLLEHAINSSKKRQAFSATDSNLLISDPEISERLTNYVKERTEYRKPLQYILGTQPFGDLELVVRPPTLIPRWETEEWVINLCSMISKSVTTTSGNNEKLRILDIGIGSGCISLLLASKLPSNSVEIVGIDKHSRALDLALENKTRNSSILRNPVNFLQTDIFDDDAVQRLINITGGADIIISNPPYIPPSLYSELPPDVKDWEDRSALLAEDEHGLTFYQRIIDLAVAPTKPLLRSTFQSDTSRIPSSRDQLPQIVFEIGTSQQANHVSRIAKSHFDRAETLQDLAKQDRVVLIYSPSN